MRDEKLHTVGVKHVSKSRCTKHTRVGPLLEDVEKVHAVVARITFESEHVKNTTCSDHFLTIRLPFDVEKVHTVVARSTFGSQTRQRLRVLGLF